MVMEKSADTAPTSKPRLTGLDLLRLLAVVFVLGRHIIWPIPETWSGGWPVILGAWKHMGWTGVDLFFVLSGFLVSGLLFSEYKSHGSLSIGRFYVRRWWKIYPPFFILTVFFVCMQLFVGVQINWEWVLAELLFVQNYFRGIWGIWEYTWSLAVEEHFYLLLPLTLVLMLRRNKNSPTPFKHILTLTGCVMLIALVLRVLTAYYYPVYSYEQHLYPTHLRIDSLLFGVAISYLYHFHDKKFIEVMHPWRHWLIFGGLILFIPALIFELEETPFLYTLGFSIFSLGSGMLLVGVLLSNTPNHPVVNFLAKLGSYSYSIYLWHMPIRLVVVPVINSALGKTLGYGEQTVIYLVLSLVVGILMSKLVEWPVLRLRDRLFPSRTKKVVNL